MNLDEFITQKEQQTKITHQQFINKFEQLQKRPDTHLGRDLVKADPYIASSDLKDIEKGFKPWLYNIPQLIIDKHDNFSLDEILTDVKTDFINNIVAIFNLDRTSFAIKYDKEIQKRVNHAYHKANMANKKIIKKELKYWFFSFGFVLLCILFAIFWIVKVY